MVKKNAGDTGLIPGLGSSPGGGSMATLSSSLAWEIPWTEEAGRLQSMGSKSLTQLSTSFGEVIVTESLI